MPIESINLFSQRARKLSSKFEKISMSIKSTYRPPISLQHSANRYVIETNNPAPPTLCLDDRSTYPISQHARTTKYASKTQSHEQGTNRSTKPSASMESSSMTSFLKAKSSRELDINGHICPDLEVDKISRGWSPAKEK